MSGPEMPRKRKIHVHRAGVTAILAGRAAVQELVPMQPGDALETCADSSDLERVVGFRPNTTIEDDTRLFVEWFRAIMESMESRRVRAHYRVRAWHRYVGWRMLKM